MSTTLETMRCRLEAQGYVGLSDEELAEVGPWGPSEALLDSRRLHYSL